MVIRTQPSSKTTVRLTECANGHGFETTERITGRVPVTTGTPAVITGNSVPLSLSDPISSPSVLEDPPERARSIAPTYPPEFEKLWAIYPRKEGKGAAVRAWKKVRPHFEAIAAALEWQRKSRQWTDKGGLFIPHFSTYLNNRRWEDSPSAAAPSEQPARTQNTQAVLSRFLDRHKESA